MHLSTRFALTGLVLASFAGLAACSGNKICSSTAAAPRSDDAKNAGASSSGGAAPSAGADTSAVASRAIAEADIVQLDDEQDRIYAMSKSGTLAIVDARTPGTLSMMGKTSLPGEPFEMYRRGDVLLTMSNAAVKGDGVLYEISPEEVAPRTADPTSGAVIAAIDIHDPASARTTATFKVPGEIADSRIVGNVLYLATYENASCWGCGKQPRTLVTSFDVSTPSAPKQIDQATFDTSPDAGGFNAAWSTPWKRSIIATNERLYVGGLATDGTKTTDEGVIEVLDISDPGGHLVRSAKITMAGPVMSRWQMDESAGVLRVISQRGAGRTQNGEQYPGVDTYRIESSSSLVRVGHTTMSLPRQEGLKTVRFDGARAYAITFNQTDPLFAIDLSDPTQPAQKGQLQMPGWVFHLEPRGQWLLGLGLDRNDASGNLNASLVDVSDLSAPKLVNRVSFGPKGMYEDYLITSGVLAEDQDRIQKAFRIFYDGLIAVPFSGGQGACTAQGGGVQLIDWSEGSLTKRGFVPMAGNPRRAVRRDSDAMHELIGISDSNVTAFQIDQRDAPKQLADVTIGTCVARASTLSFGGFGEGDDVVAGGGRPVANGGGYGSGSDLCE